MTALAGPYPPSMRAQAAPVLLLVLGMLRRATAS
jgi:hypothetical protein